jgi:hypothetical protein
MAVINVVDYMESKREMQMHQNAYTRLLLVLYCVLLYNAVVGKQDWSSIDYMLSS